MRTTICCFLKLYLVSFNKIIIFCFLFISSTPLSPSSNSLSFFALPLSWWVLWCSQWSQWSRGGRSGVVPSVRLLGHQSLGLRFSRCSLSLSPSAPKGWLRRLGFSSDPPPLAARALGWRQAWGGGLRGYRVVVVGFYFRWVSVVKYDCE